MTELEPVAYLSGMYRDFIEGKRERVPLGVEVSLVNFNWPQQIPLVTLSSAQSAIAGRDARIAELTEQRDTWTDNDRAKAWRQSFDDMHQRAMAAEALLKEAGKVLVPFALRCHSTRNTHLLDWLPEGYDHCRLGSKDWAQAYLNSAKDYIKAFESAARSLMNKIGERNGE